MPQHWIGRGTFGGNACCALLSSRRADLLSLPATMASLCTSFEPVLVAIGATVFFGHDLSMRTILGIALVVGAVATMQIDAVLRAGKSEKSLTLAADAVEVRATAD